MSSTAADVAKRRRRTKERLVEAHGGKCLDCGYVGPPFMFDFDHRDPADKSFSISKVGGSIAWSRLLEESGKCDLVCTMCHRLRTHKQRCSGCEHCAGATPPAARAPRAERRP